VQFIELNGHGQFYARAPGNDAIERVISRMRGAGVTTGKLRSRIAGVIPVDNC